MRKPKQETNKAKEKAYKMHLEGLTNKEIAKRVHATEKTVGKWLRAYTAPLNKIEERERLYFQRVDELLHEKEFKPCELKTAINALATLQKVHFAQRKRLEA